MDRRRIVIFKPKEQDLLWDEQYIEHLMAINELRKTIAIIDATDKEDDTLSIRKKLERNEKSAKKIEAVHGVKNRWELTSSAANAVAKRLKAKSKNRLLAQLYRLSSERVFLIEMKRKYADGQSIAIKLTHEINKVVYNMKKMLGELDECDVRTEDDKEITFGDIKDPKSTIYACIDGGETSCTASSIPASTKSQIINLFCMCERCEEELDLLITELTRFVIFLVNELTKIDNIVSSIQPTLENDVGPGLQNLILSKRAGVVQELAGLQHLWSDDFCFEEDYETILTSTLNCSQDAALCLLEDDVKILDECDIDDDDDDDYSDGD